MADETNPGEEASPTDPGHVVVINDYGGCDFSFRLERPLSSQRFHGMLFLFSILLPCGYPIAPHMRTGLMVPVSKAARRANRGATEA
ncbi:hypothetical protein ACOMHN_047481 [Nucella lapillus]